MALDMITAYEQGINRLEQRIQANEKLYDEKTLSDQGLKQLLHDVGQRYYINKLLQDAKQERDRRQQAAQ